MLASALTAIGLAGTSFPAASQQATFTLDYTNSTSGTFSTGAAQLGNAQLAAGSIAGSLGGSGQVRNYVATTFTVTNAGSYTFSQSSAPTDTIMMVYSGVFNPASPAANVLAGNDDDLGATVCGSAGTCPTVTVNGLTAGQTVTLVVSTYAPERPLGNFIGPDLTLNAASPTASQNAGLVAGAPSVGIQSDAPITVSSSTPALAFANLILNNSTNSNNIIVSANGGTITAGGSSTLSGILSGAGALTFGGTGTITLTGVNTLTGPVTVGQNVTLVLGAVLVNNVPVSYGSLPVGSALVVNGTFNLSTLASGPSLASLSGTGNVALGANTLTLTNANGTLGGVISGTGGGLIISGGHLILTGTNTYTGSTIIQGGLLSINGSIGANNTSIITVGNGGTIGGNGFIIGQLTVNSGGTLAPGNSIGTLNVTGPVTLAAGSTYQVEVQNNQADKIVATGAATVASALNISAINGAWPRRQTTLRILSAAGGVTGTFSGVTFTNPPGGLEYEIIYGANDIDLVMSSLLFQDLATNRNQMSVAVALDRTAEGTLTAAQTAAMDVLYAVPEEQIARALTELSGEVHTAAMPLATRTSGLFLQTILDPSLQGRQQAGACGETLPGQAGAAQAAHCHNAGHYTVWVAPFAGNGVINGNRGMGSSTRTEQIAGMIAGADMRIDANSMVGFALGGASAQASISNGLGSLNSNVLMAGLYGMHNVGPLSLGAALGYSMMEAETKRSMGTVGIQGLESDYTVTTWSGRIQAAYALIQQPDFSFGPYAFAQAFNVNRPSFQETGAGGAVADLGVSSGSRSATDAQTELGLQLLDQGQIGAIPTSAFIRAGWRYAAAQSDDVRAQITSLPTSGFTVTGAQADEHMASIGAGLDLAVAPGVSVGGRVESLVGANTSFVTGSVRVRMEF